MTGDASITAGITPDMKLIKKYDERFRENKRYSRNLYILGIGLLFVAFLFLYLKWYIPCGIVGIIALFPIGLALNFRKMVRKSMQISTYEKGLLVTGIISSTNPLTLMVIANIYNNGDVPDQFAVRSWRVKNLPGHNLEVGEKIPCSAFFSSGDDPNYWNNFEARPVCWATNDREAVKRSVEMCDKADWDALETLSVELSTENSDSMYILDENYELILEKNYYCEESTGQQREEWEKSYEKQYGDITYVPKEVEHSTFYDKWMDISVKMGVYEYFFTETEENHFLTYPKDPIKFSNKLQKQKVNLVFDEVPLILGKFLITTKGMWQKGVFTPWENIEFEITNLAFGGYIDICLNGNSQGEIKVEYKYYGMNENDVSKAEKKAIQKLERNHLQQFFQELPSLDKN